MTLVPALQTGQNPFTQPGVGSTPFRKHHGLKR
jgi:hypothetical protein